VPPQDGDGIYGGRDQDLVAQIIPLRRAQTRPGSQLRVSNPADDASLPSERSIWDQPTIEVRRPKATPEARHTQALGQRARQSRWIAGTALTALGLLAAAAVMLATGALKGHRASPKAVPSTSAGLRATGSTAGPAGGSSLLSKPRVAERGRVTHGNGHVQITRRHRTGAGTRAADVVHRASGSATTEASPGVSTASGAAGETPSKGLPWQQPAGDAKPVDVESAVSSSAAGSSPAADQCVPGELGC
jgi:hypothetical protein